MVAKGLVGGMLAAVALVAVVPSIAQVPNPSAVPELPYDRGYDKSSQHEQAMNANEAPVTQALNADAAASADAGAMANADAQAQYDSDMAGYRAQVMASHRQAMRDQRHYDRQQRAYADAMADWRALVRACEAGHNRACRLPTPNPADYY